MNLLVTGAGGFLGRSVVRAVLAHDPAARVVGLDPSPRPSNLPDSVAWEPGSAADGALVERTLRSHSVDTVAHLARGSDGTDIATLMAEHAGVTLTVLGAVARAGGVQRVLIPGSAAEYGLFTEAELPIPEDRVPRPATPYGYAKLAETSLALLAPGSLGVPALVARVFNPVGPGQSRRFLCGSLVAQFSRMLAARVPLPLQVGALSPMRDFVDAADVAEALRLLLLHGQPGLCYNVGSGRGTRVADVVGMLEELTGIHPPLAAAPPAAAPPPSSEPSAEHSVADVSRLLAATGHRCETPLRVTLTRMLEAAAAN
jgi:GDP-4-dehydro-6-deoxy-D-mannose reductase